MDAFRPYTFKMENERVGINPLIRRRPQRRHLGNRNNIVGLSRRNIVGANCAGLSPSNRLRCLNNRFK